MIISQCTHEIEEYLLALFSFNYSLSIRQLETSMSIASQEKLIGLFRQLI